MLYISNGGDALGPYEISQLRAMWNAGHITANTLYWDADGNEWRNIAELKLGESPSVAAQSVAPETTEPAAAAALSTEERQDLYKRRSNAFVVDLLIGIAMVAGLIYLGSLADLHEGILVLTAMGCALAYFLLQDSLPRGQSVGKRLYGIQTLQLKPLRPCGVWRSAARNSILWGMILGPLLVGSALAAMLKAGGAGGLIVGMISIGILAIMFGQLERVRSHPCGQTLADEWSGTQVLRLQS
jgi:hypothetical protein